MTYKYLKYNHLEILRRLARFNNYDKYNALNKLDIYGYEDDVLEEIEDAFLKLSSHSEYDFSHMVI
jgi:sulfate adenylyltransferase subunit 1 (EFTu-like GTPase family)